MPKGDIEAMKADTKDGYTPIANLILEALAMAKLSGVQKGICLFLFRRTYGWGKKEDAITLNEFAQACDTSPAYVSRQLKQLIEWNVVQRVSYEPGKIPVYTFNTRVAEWCKGCINVQGLHKKSIQGLYKCATPPLHKCARVEVPPSLENTGLEGAPKESIKENINIYTFPYGKEQAATGGGENISGVANDEPTNQQLIAELTSEYRKVVPPDKHQKGDYAFIGRLYNEYGYDTVLVAIQEMAYKRDAGFIPDKPLIFLRGMLKRGEGNGARDKPRKPRAIGEDLPLL